MIVLNFISSKPLTTYYFLSTILVNGSSLGDLRARGLFYKKEREIWQIKSIKPIFSK